MAEMAIPHLEIWTIHFMTLIMRRYV